MFEMLAAFVTYDRTKIWMNENESIVVNNERVATNTQLAMVRKVNQTIVT